MTLFPLVFVCLCEFFIHFILFSLWLYIIYCYIICCYSIMFMYLFNFLNSMTNTRYKCIHKWLSSVYSLFTCLCDYLLVQVILSLLANFMFKIHVNDKKKKKIKKFRRAFRNFLNWSFFHDSSQNIQVFISTESMITFGKVDQQYAIRVHAGLSL